MDRNKRSDIRLVLLAQKQHDRLLLAVGMRMSASDGWNILNHSQQIRAAYGRANRNRGNLMFCAYFHAPVNSLPYVFSCIDSGPPALPAASACRKRCHSEPVFTLAWESRGFSKHFYRNSCILLLFLGIATPVTSVTGSR